MTADVYYNTYGYSKVQGGTPSVTSGRITCGSGVSLKLNLPAGIGQIVYITAYGDSYWNGVSSADLTLKLPLYKWDSTDKGTVTNYYLSYGYLRCCYGTAFSYIGDSDDSAQFTISQYPINGIYISGFGGSNHGMAVGTIEIGYYG